jgi:hypothetical protein
MRLKWHKIIVINVINYFFPLRLEVGEGKLSAADDDEKKLSTSGV